MSGTPAFILSYHKVGPEAEEGRSLNIEPARLESHIRYFKRRNFRFVRGGDFGAKWPEGAICLTFDDAYVSALTYGKEAMIRQGVCGTYYVVSSCVGGTSVWDGEKSRPLADEFLLREAHSQGFELGNHTKTHPHLAGLGPQTVEELADCRAWLQGLGISGESFCYPYGSLDSDAVEAVGMAGYRVGMALGKRPALPSDPRLQLPRIVVAFSHTLPMLLYKIYVRPKLLRSA